MSSDVLGPARPAQAALNSCSGPQSLDWRPGTGSQRRGERPEIVSSEHYGDVRDGGDLGPGDELPGCWSDKTKTDDNCSSV